MASFLAHEAEAEVAAAAAIARESVLQSRCEALSRDLSDARSAHEEVMGQLVELQRRLNEYEAKEEVESQYRVRRLCMRIHVMTVVTLAAVNLAECDLVVLTSEAGGSGCSSADGGGRSGGWRRCSEWRAWNARTASTRTATTEDGGGDEAEDAGDDGAEVRRDGGGGRAE